MKPYYEHGGITIYHGDCREWMPVADVVVADPPYGHKSRHEGPCRRIHALVKEALERAA